MIRKLLLTVTTLAAITCAGCSCQQSGYKQLVSPDKRYVLIERELNCSALDPYRVTISIRSTRPRLGFAWLGYPHKEVFAADVGLPDTKIKWLDDHNLEIACNDATCVKYGIAERVYEWRDVKIHFNVGKAKKGPY